MWLWPYHGATKEGETKEYRDAPGIHKLWDGGEAQQGSRLTKVFVISKARHVVNGQQRQPEPHVRQWLAGNVNLCQGVRDACGFHILRNVKAEAPATGKGKSLR